MSALLVETAFFAGESKLSAMMKGRIQSKTQLSEYDSYRENQPAHWYYAEFQLNGMFFHFSKAWAFFRPTSLREQLKFFANKCSWKTRNEKLTMWWDSVLPWSIFSIPHFILLSFPCVSWVTCTSSYTRNLSLTYPFLVHWGLLKKTFKTWNCSQ